MRKLGGDCPICMDELAPSSLAALVTCGHVFCYDCITRYLNDQSTGGRLKCPMCRAPVYRGDRPLKLFIDTKSGNSSSPSRPPRADPGADAELHKLRKEYEALKNSSHEQIQELTRHNNLLSGAKIQLENKLYEAHRTTSASVKNSHRTIRALVAAADTARSEVDALKTDNSRLLAQVEGLTMCKQGHENLLKQLRGSLEATRQAAYTRVRRLTEENTERLEEWEYQAERLIREANRRVLDKSTECRALSQRIQEVQEDACARISIMQNQLAEAKAITEQFLARGQDSAQLNSNLTITLALVRRERDQYAAKEEARSTQYREIMGKYKALARERDSLVEERAMFMRARAEGRAAAPLQELNGTHRRPRRGRRYGR